MGDATIMAFVWHGDERSPCRAESREKSRPKTVDAKKEMAKKLP